MNKKLCECCQKSMCTHRYFISNVETSWARQWCRKCFKSWIKKAINPSDPMKLLVVKQCPPWREKLRVWRLKLRLLGLKLIGGSVK